MLSKAMSTPQSSITRCLRILVADDHYANQLLTQSLLLRDGHEVYLASNGQAAMTLCDAHSFDLILLDIQMPVLDGFETLRKIRKGSSRNSDCLIFALTAYSGPREIAQIKRAGFSAVLTKPFRSADMYAFLNGSGRGQAVPTVGTSTLLTTVHNGPPDLQAVTVEPLLAMPILNELRAAAGTARVRHIAKVFWKDVAEILARIRQHEMAYRMQMSVPDVMDISKEPQSIIDLYGEDCQVPGTYAANAPQARRLAENGVRFIQLYHQGWDQHGNLHNEMARQAKDVDQASAALVMDLKQRGMLEDTLVIWGGEFGRGNYAQGKFDPENYGRDHHPRAFSIWMAGGGIKPGLNYGQTDEFGYNVVENPVHINDFHATLMHQMGIDHEQLIYKYQGRRFRLTDVAGNVVKDLLA